MRTRKGSDFVVGLVTLTALVVLVVGVLWLKGEGFSAAPQNYKVLFPQVGGLQKGDPVAVNGLRIGSVADIVLYEDELLVTLGLQKELAITTASTVAIVESGLLGEKKVEIFYVAKGDVIDPQTAHPIRGEYHGGIAEAAVSLGQMAGQISIVLDTLQESFNKISTMMQGENSLVSFLDTMVVRLDKITASTERIIVSNEKSLQKTVRNLHALSEESRTFFQENRESVGAIIANADTLAVELRSVLARLDNVVSEIDSGDGLLSELLHNDDLTESVVGSLNQLDSLVEDIRDEGVKVRVRLGHRERNKKRKDKKSKE